MIEYVKSKGVDITSEFTYKETEDLKNKPIFGLPRDHHRKAPMDTVGLIPMSWWCYRMTDDELLRYPPQIYCGGEFREKRLNSIFYGNMHGEDIVTKDNPHWARDFIYRFATYQLPCHFLNAHKRLAVKGKGNEKYCAFSDNIIAYAKGKRITRNGETVKDGDTLLLPLTQKEKTYVAYSKNGDNRQWKVFENGVAKAKIYKITENGNEYLNETEIQNGTLALTLAPDTAYLVEYV